MRRVHLRGHEHILKRLLIHSGAYNLGLRQMIGVGTPRGSQGRAVAVLGTLLTLMRSYRGAGDAIPAEKRPLFNT